jgi:heme-degrading monooxygenase HmoA
MLPMVVTVFRSRLLPGVREEYLELVARMNELAASMPGYISHKGFFAEDGERVTIVEFESPETLQAWRMQPEHMQAQRRARRVFYSEYSVQVCEIVRESKFKREQTAGVGAPA